MWQGGCGREKNANRGNWVGRRERGKGEREGKNEERGRKDSTSSIDSSVGSMEIYWGKKREREEEEGTGEGGRGGFKRSGKTGRWPEGGNQWVGSCGG